MFVSCIFPWIVLSFTLTSCEGERMDCPVLPFGLFNHCTTFGDTSYTYVNPSVIHHGTSCNITCPSSGEITQVTCHHGKWDGMPSRCIPPDYKPPDINMLSRHKRQTEEEQLMQLLAKMGGDVSSLQSMFQGRTAPPMDMSGPMLTCPPSLHEYADSMQVTTRVAWEEPVAIDSEDGQLKPKRYGAGPQWTYGEGTKKTVYLARDMAGNLGKCEINITVEVVRCKSGSKEDIPNGYYSCHPTPEFMYGATCEYGCYQGYELVGEKLLTCEKSGKWSHDVPKCRALTCPVLRPFALGYYTCTDGNNYKSLCTYTCKKGYVIKSRMSRVRVCIADKLWRGEEPICEDKESPQFENCPASITAAVEAGSTSAMVTWDEPNVKDNSLENIKPTLVSKIKNNAKANVGVYDVVYEAKDKAGNKAKPCRFKVIVKELTCPVQYALPFMKVSCPSGTSLGAKCTFSCQSGWVLNGTETTECMKSKTIPPYASWDWSTGRPICNVIEPCPKPEPPVNGALACDLWEDGRFCQMQCMKGTDIPPSFTAWKLFVCSDTGKWNFNGKVPACEKTKGAKGTVMSVSMNYFDGKCPDPKVQTQIKKNFIAALHNTPFTETWKKTDSKPENVKVLCGAIRMKRSVDGKKKFKIELKVDITNKLNPAIDTATAMEKIKTGASSILTLMKDDVTGNKSKLLPLSLVPNRKIDVESKGVELHCTVGLFPSYRTQSCVGCTQGTFFNEASRKCEECPRGQFQPLSGQNQCVDCPDGKTTPHIGAISSEVCQSACKQGTFSKDGVEPCLPCEMGYYQPAKGSNLCQQCPGGTTTLFQGSKTAAGCEDFGLVFSNNGNAEAKTELIENPIRDTFVLTFWLNLASSGPSHILTLTSENSLHCRADENGEIVFNTEKNTGVESSIPRDRWVYFHVTITLDTLSIAVNGAAAKQHKFHGDGIAINKTLMINIGGDGFKGSLYQVNVWSSSKAPKSDRTPRCQHTGTGDIISWTDFAKVRLTNGSLQSPSACDDTDECASNPCIHGTCVDGVKSYHCNCHDGYRGDNCDVNIDDCENNLCENGATCVDGVSNYTCVCTQHHTGELCGEKITDGQWAEWGQWRECSKSCGGGEKSRGRRCDNPAPNNGGKKCPGKDKETDICNTHKCPECVKLVAPEHGSLMCQDIGELHQCHVSCKDGYAFETKPRDVYECGVTTGHEWNFRSEGAQNTSLPRCIKMKTPKEMQITFKAEYADLICGDNSDGVTSAVTLIAKKEAGNLLCSKLKLCEVKVVKIHNCEDRKRQKRDTKQAAVSFSITITNIPGTGVQSSMRQLNGALSQLKTAVKDGKFNLDLNGKRYKVTGDPKVEGGVTCDVGHTRVDTHCIPCAPGTFYHDGYCEHCEKGSFQPKDTQATCEFCPTGTTTQGKGAITQDECSVTCGPGHYMKDKVCELCRRGEYQDQQRQMACKPCPQGHITLHQGATNEKECIDPNKSPPIPAKPEAEDPVEPEDDLSPILYQRGFPVGIVMGVVGIACLCIMAITLIACKIRYHRFNRIHAMDIDSQLQAIARAVTYITVPITGIQANKLALPPAHKKDI